MNLALTIFLYILLTFLLILALVIFVGEYLFFSRKSAPYLPSGRRIINQIMATIDFKPGAKIYDLGCGDGQVLRALEKNGQFELIGYEYYILPFVIAKIINLLKGSRVKIKWGDFFKEKISDADYVFCYLCPEQNEQLKNKLQAELKPGSLVISNSFSFNNWQPEQIIYIDPNRKHGLNRVAYIYKI